MTDTLDLARLCHDVVNCILHETSPCSVNVVVPPGFDDQKVGDALVVALSAGAQNRPIARLTMDELPDATTFVRRLATGLNLPVPASGDPSRNLERLLRHQQQPVLYVLQKFHRTLALLPPWVLAHLRSAEQAGRARAIVISHASHARLKKRWRTKGHPLIVSDYGDTHVRHVVRLLDADHIKLALYGQASSIVLDFILGATGGYPEILHKTLTQWSRMRSNGLLDSALKRQLVREASHASYRLVDWLEDDEGDMYFHRVIIDLYHGHKKEQARAALHDHELRQLLLDNDGELRAHALAHAALTREREMLLRVAEAQTIVERARALYLRAEYEHAHELLVRGSHIDLDAQLLSRHAQIMRMLTEVDPTLRIDWHMLASTVEEAASLAEKVSIDETGELRRRYQGLLQIARAIANAGQPRDILEFAQGGSREAPGESDRRERTHAALLVSAQCICNAETLPNDVGGLSHVLGLPQQLFQMWAWWTLDLDHASAPELDNVALSPILSGWGWDPPVFPQPGDRFTSFRTFAMLGVALLEQRGQLGMAPWLEPTRLKPDLDLLDDVRTPSQRSASHRRTLYAAFLSLCHRWFRGVLGAAASTINDLDRHLLAPLPLSERGEHLDWSMCTRPTLLALFEAPLNSSSLPLPLASSTPNATSLRKSELARHHTGRMIDEGLPKRLLDASASRTLIPFAGAGVSMSVKRTDGKRAFPDWIGLLRKMAARLETEQRPQHTLVTAFVDQPTPNTMEAARYARDGLGALWGPFLREEFGPSRDTIADGSLSLARAIWQLGSKLVITTNFDRVLRWASPNSDDVYEWQIEAADGMTEALRRGLSQPTIWHLHGSIADATKIILSPDGYRQLYPSPESEAIYKTALTALRNLMVSNHFLFVGFSMEDAFMVRQLEWVDQTFAGCAGPHYVLVHREELSAMRAKLTGKGIDVQPVVFEDFGEPLVNLLNRIANVQGN